MADATDRVKDAFYVTVGLGVLSFQRAQVRRQDLRRQVQGTREQVQRLARDLDDRVEPVIDQLEERIEPVVGTLEQRLPSQAGTIVRRTKDAVRDARGQVRSRVAGGPHPSPV